jgi:hypothetical protein
MKWMILICICMTIAFINGCAKSLPPHEELNQALKKSLDTSGFNYSSKSRITHLSYPKPDAKADPDDKSLKYGGALPDIARGFSINVDGAVDMQNKKSEALYDLHYSKDNVEVSIKLPLLIDYSTKTIYVGSSIFHTLLDMASPQEAGSKGKLIRINIPELVREESVDSPDLSKMFADDRFSQKNMDIINNVFKTTVIKAVAKLKDANISDQPLTEQDRKAGIERRIQIKLGHNEAVTVVLDLIDGISQALFQEGVISKKEYAVLLTLSDRQKIDEFMNKFEMSLMQDVGVNSGYVRNVVSRLNVADKEGKYQVGVENVSEFNDYNSPHFTIHPEASQFIDFKEVLNSIKSFKTKDQKASQPDLEAPEGNSKKDVSPQQ